MVTDRMLWDFKNLCFFFLRISFELQIPPSQNYIRNNPLKSMGSNRWAGDKIMEEQKQLVLFVLQNCYKPVRGRDLA